MKIRDDHLYHGAVLNQIAEHKQFTAINALKVKGRSSRSTFKVNDTIAVYLKYASKPLGRYKEYNFTFLKQHLSELRAINKVGNDLHLALICVKDREICCLLYSDFLDWINKRKEAFGKKEDQYTLLVTIKTGQAFRVYMNEPGKKGTYLSSPQKVARNRCPNALFE